MSIRLRKEPLSVEDLAVHVTAYYRELLFLFLAALLYLSLHTIYRIANVDDAWSLSFAYNYLFKHISYDLTFGAVTGGCGVMYFGKTYAYLYGALLDVWGWTKSNSLLISTLFIWLAAGLWYRIIRRLSGNNLLARWFALLMLVIEPFFQAANEARPDALTFFLVTLAFFAMLADKPFWAGLCAMIAFETHPLGITAFFYILAAVIAPLAEERSPGRGFARRALGFSSGIGIGLLYYFLLHYQFLGGLTREVAASNQGRRVFDNFILEYFCYFDFARHAPELILAAAALVIFVRRQFYKDNRQLPVLLIVLPFVTVLVKRPNFRYIIYIYPALLWLALETFARMKRLKWAVLIYVFLLLPPYTWFILNHHGYRVDAYVSKVTTAVPRDGLPVVGGADDWFAFKNRRFYAVNYGAKFRRLHLKAFYLIENPQYHRAEFPGLKRIVRRYYTTRLVSRFRINRQTYRVRLVKAKKKRRFQPKGPAAIICQ